MTRIAIFTLLCLLAFEPFAVAEEKLVCENLLLQRDEALQKLTAENVLLLEKVKVLEGGITRDILVRKNLQHLQEIAADTKTQRKSMADFEVYVKWMGGNLSGYSKYLEAGSIAAGFAKVLPIPYAGQAGLFTKFASQFALSLNGTSVAISRYLNTSQQFVSRVEALDPTGPNGAEVSALAKLADEQLLKDMNDVRTKLATTGELSASVLSFLESLNHYLSSTDEYWNKTKAVFKKGDVEKKEKGFLAESIQGLRSRAGSFAGNLKAFDETAQKDAPLIKSLMTYEELIREADLRMVQVQAKTATGP